MSQQMSQNSSNNAQAQAALGSDYINRVRALVSSLKESLANLMKLTANTITFNSHVDSGLKAPDEKIDRFDKAWEEFNSICNQIELVLKTIYECAMQQKDSRSYMPFAVATANNKSEAHTMDGDNSVISYTQYVHTIKNQIMYAESIQEILLEGARKVSQTDVNMISMQQQQQQQQQQQMNNPNQQASMMHNHPPQQQQPQQMVPHPGTNAQMHQMSGNMQHAGMNTMMNPNMNTNQAINQQMPGQMMSKGAQGQMNQIMSNQPQPQQQYGQPQMHTQQQIMSGQMSPQVMSSSQPGTPQLSQQQQQSPMMMGQQQQQITQQQQQMPQMSQQMNLTHQQKQQQQQQMMQMHNNQMQ